MKIRLSWMLLAILSVILLGGCAPAMFEVKRGSTVPVLVSESWGLELTNSRSGSRKQFDVRLSSPVQEALREGTGFKVQVGNRSVILLGSDMVRYANLSVGNGTGIAIIGNGSNGKFMMIFPDVSSAFTVESSSCYFRTWDDDSVQIQGTHSVLQVDGSSTRSVSVGMCVLSRSR